MTLIHEDVEVPYSCSLERREVHRLTYDKTIQYALTLVSDGSKQ